MQTRSVRRAGGTVRPLTFDLAVEILRPPQAVFDVLADVQLYVDTVPASGLVRMSKHPGGPTRVGTRWHERVRILPGWWMSVDSVVTEVEPPTLLGMDFRSRWFRGHLTYTLEAVPGGCRLRQRETLRPVGPVRLVARQVDASLRPRLLQRLDDLRTLLESTLPSLREH